MLFQGCLCQVYETVYAEDAFQTVLLEASECNKVSSVCDPWSSRIQETIKNTFVYKTDTLVASFKPLWFHTRSLRAVRTSVAFCNRCVISFPVDGTAQLGELFQNLQPLGLHIYWRFYIHQHLHFLFIMRYRFRIISVQEVPNPCFMSNRSLPEVRFRIWIPCVQYEKGLNKPKEKNSIGATCSPNFTHVITLIASESVN